MRGLRTVLHIMCFPCTDQVPLPLIFHMPYHAREAKRTIGDLGVVVLDVLGYPFAHALQMLWLLFYLKLLRPEGTFVCFATSRLSQCVGNGVRATHVVHNVMADSRRLAANKGWCIMPVALGKDVKSGYSRMMQFYAVLLAKIDK